MLVDPAICQWSPAPYLFFSGNIWGNFVYYSHLFPSISALIIAIFVFKQNPRGRVNQALLFMVSMFTVWCLVDLILWATDRADLIMFLWSSLIYFELLIYVGALYFIYAFIEDRRPHWLVEALLFTTFIPLFLFGHTPLNLVAFDFTNCWREAIEGPLWNIYLYNIEIAIVLWIAVYGARKLRTTETATRRQEIAIATIGVIAFLGSFSIGNILGSLETNWELGQYGLFGMPVFVTLMTYLIVRYQTFNAKLIATEALIAGLGVLLLSLLFVRRIENVHTITAITLVLTTALGMLLVRSVRREITQRQEIEKLAKRLEKVNGRLKELDRMKSEFVSIASHQLRSPLTSIRGYTSMLQEGSYGTLPEKAREAVNRIAESSRLMAMSVEDYLNVSRIQSGNMKYELTDFNLRDLASRTVDDLRREAIRRGLLLMFKDDLQGARGIVHADLGKADQILHNLIDNALKYTPRGSIEVRVYASKRPKHLCVDVSDSGIGMKPDQIEDLFEKFKRADNANSVNVTGTGLGLYIARKMAQDMGGDITASSPGEGLGSTFTLCLPLQL